MTRTFRPTATAALAVLAAVAAGTAATTPATAAGHARRVAHAEHPARSVARPNTLPGGYQHLVVIYEENHSFDNLYGTWGDVNGQHVNGLDTADASSTQVAQDGTPFACLPQNDVNLTSPPLPGDCTDAAHGITSHFPNRPFSIDDHVAPEDTTCPTPGGPPTPRGVRKGEGEPGGCTEDLVHRFYQEQYQIHDGRQDRYTTGSDAVGLTQGTYRTQQLPIWKYLHEKGAPRYVVADNFFQAAFGGSFLNHQFLIAGRAPLDTDPKATYSTATPPQVAKNSVLDENAMPVNNYPQYKTDRSVVDDRLTAKCAVGSAGSYAKACGNYAVNTIQPGSGPHGGGPYLPLIDDAAYPNIGDRLSAKGISWNWYAGGWDDAASGKPGALFQYHHQPFNYFANYAEGGSGRSHLQDETKFLSAVDDGSLPAVSFVKPYGAENEHPGYASEPGGSDHLVDLLKRVTNGPEAGNTLVVVTYDEFGGQWDHVSPPKVDAWGPGTRVPALVIGRSLTRSGVDHTPYDTTSILATIEHSFGLEPLSSRDAHVNDLSAAVAAGGR